MCTPNLVKFQVQVLYRVRLSIINTEYLANKTPWRSITDATIAQPSALDGAYQCGSHHHFYYGHHTVP
jgi:hypothetical protein